MFQLKNEENCFVKINCIHPGVVKTDLYTHVGWVKVRPRGLFLYIRVPYFKSALVLREQMLLLGKKIENLCPDY